MSAVLYAAKINWQHAQTVSQSPISPRLVCLACNPEMHPEHRPSSGHVHYTHQLPCTCCGALQGIRLHIVQLWCAVLHCTAGLDMLMHCYIERMESTVTNWYNNILVVDLQVCSTVQYTCSTPAVCCAVRMGHRHPAAPSMVLCMVGCACH